MKKLTAGYLVKHGACHDQVALFRKTFPDGATITYGNLAKALQAGLSVGWITNTIQGSAWAEYKRIQGSAWAEYERIQGSAWAEYKRIQGSAWAEYERIQDSARAEYERIQDSAILAALKLQDD